MTSTSSQGSNNPQDFQNLQSTESVLPQKEFAKKSFSTQQINLGVLIFIIFIGSLYGVYAFEENKIKEINSKVDSLNKQIASQNKQIASQNEQITAMKTQASSNYAPGYRGGVSGVKLKQPVATMATQTLEIIEIYYKQNDSYPDSETVPMIQLWQDNGYNGASAAGSLKCPDYNGYFSYTGFQDPTSGTVTTFKLYYCDGTNLITKSQTDI